MPPRAAPPPGPAAVLLPEPAPRVPGRRPPIRTGHSPPESVQTNPPTPTTPQRTLGASVMPSGELLRHGRYLGPLQLRHLDVLPLRRPRPHRKRGRATAGKYVLVNPDRVNWAEEGGIPPAGSRPGRSARMHAANPSCKSRAGCDLPWRYQCRHAGHHLAVAATAPSGRRRTLNRPVRPRVS
jgi:hypothetical protein